MLKVLLTNDDGIHAPGLEIAERVAQDLGAEVLVLAPEQDCSGLSQGITMHTPLRLRECGDNRFALSGTPADCVLFASAHFYQNGGPDLVISGVNSGANVGDAVQYSATIGAALTAAHLGWRSVALSQAFLGDRNQIDWSASEVLAAAYIEQCLAIDEVQSWNINFPAVAHDAVQGYRYCRQAERNIHSVKANMTADGRGIHSYWLAFNKSVGTGEQEDTDIAALKDHYVALMPLLAHRADVRLLKQLEQAQSKIKTG